MGRFSCFILGVVVGAGAVFGALKYHIVHANDGLHLVPKMTAEFQGAYVDIRDFDFNDWNEHRSLAAALVKADKAHLMGESTMNAFGQTLSAVLDGLSIQRR